MLVGVYVPLQQLIIDLRFCVSLDRKWGRYSELRSWLVHVVTCKFKTYSHLTLMCVLLWTIVSAQSSSDKFLS